MRIGVVGTGRMGAAMASRLLTLGHEVTVWNRTVEKTRPLAQAGAIVAATPRELVGQIEFAISMLADAQAIDTVYNGPQGLLSGDAAGKLFIEMSTVRPENQKALAAKVRAKGGAMVECPVGGTVFPAKEGKLFGFAGGEAADVARAKPILDQLCRRVEHVGPIGSGASMKLAINLPLLVFWQSFGEALSLCASIGLDPARLIDIFSDTSGGPNFLKVRGSVIAGTLQGKDAGPVTFNVDFVRKDLQTMLAEAKSLGVELPVSARALECFDQAAREGHGGEDSAMLPATWLKRARSRT